MYDLSKEEDRSRKFLRSHLTLLIVAIVLLMAILAIVVVVVVVVGAPPPHQLCLPDCAC